VIRVDSITIKEFRGIRDLTLDFKEKNLPSVVPTARERVVWLTLWSLPSLGTCRVFREREEGRSLSNSTDLTWTGGTTQTRHA